MCRGKRVYPSDISNLKNDKRCRPCTVVAAAAADVDGGGGVPFRKYTCDNIDDINDDSMNKLKLCNLLNG